MRRAFNQSLLVGILAIVASLIVNAGFAYWNIRHLNEDAAWVAHTHEVLNLASNVQLKLTDAESIQKGFLVTGKDEFLQPYQPALEQLNAKLADLKEKTQDNPRQQKRIAAIEELVAAYLARLQVGIDRRRNGLDTPQAGLNLTKVRQQKHAIRDLMAELEEDEQALLKDRESQASRAYGFAITTGILATALALVLIAALVLFLQRSRLAQYRAEEMIRKVNTDLQDRVEKRTTELRTTTAALSQADINLSGSEQMLRQSEERVQELTAHIEQVLWMIDTRESKFLYVSPGYEQMWGRSCQSLVEHPHSLLEGIDPLDREMMRRAEGVLHQTGQIDAECRVVRPDASVRWVWIRGYPITEHGQIVRSVGVIEDVTEKRRLAAEREALLSRLQLHIERMPLAYILFDADFRIIDWSPTAARIFGYNREEMLGTGPPYEKFVPRALWPGEEELRKRIRAGDMNAHSIHENRTKKGSTITCQWFNTPLMDDHGQFVGLLCLAEDVTERKSLEEQFRQSQKMEAVGQLAAGVAHDFNNLLTIILGYSDLYLAKLPAADPRREPVVQIRKAGERAALLTNQLLAFARKQILSPVVLDLNSLMNEIEKMLRCLIGADIELITILQPGLGRVKVDPGQVGQIIMNLAVNARDAMPTGGRLTVQTSNTVLAEAQARHHPDLPRGAYTLLAVSDTGSGMDEATKARIFEPFFTTKETGKGTGLGLATVFGIIKQSGGFIEVESALGLGSTFRTYLPQIPEAVRLKEAGQGMVKMPRGSETILLVEDEDAVRELAQLVLEASGYKVLSMRNGGDAVRVCYEHADKIHLLLTDVVMPRMSGRQLTELLVPFRRDMKVLYMSGYTGDTMVRHGIQDVGAHFLPKPFTPVALAQKVREVLDEPPGKAEMEAAAATARGVAVHAASLLAGPVPLPAEGG